eukprot:552644_1
MSVRYAVDDVFEFLSSESEPVPEKATLATETVTLVTETVKSAFEKTKWVFRKFMPNKSKSVEEEVGLSGDEDNTAFPWRGTDPNDEFLGVRALSGFWKMEDPNCVEGV